MTLCFFKWERQTVKVMGVVVVGRRLWGSPGTPAGLCGHKPLSEKLITTGPSHADFTHTQKHIPILCTMEPQFTNTRE